MRIGIIGMGIIWETVHMPILGEMSDFFEITAFCARTEENLNRWRNKFPSAAPYTNYAELLKDKSVDAVLVATPINLNAAVALDSLNMGKHVFLEKPIALSYQSGMELREAEARSGKTVYLLEQAAYHPQIPAIKELIAAEEIGKLVSYERVSHFSIDDAGPYADSKWRKDADFPLGLIFDAGFHDMAVLTCVFGLPHTAYSLGVNLRQGMGEYDHIMSIFSYDGEVNGMFSHSSFLCGRGYFIIRGTEGTLFVEDSRLLVESKTGAKKEIETPVSDIYVRMWKCLAEAAQKGTQPFFPSSDAVEMLRVYDAMGRSLKSGLPEKV